MIISFNDLTKGNTNAHSAKRSQIPNLLYQILIISDLGSRKKFFLVNLEKVNFEKKSIKQTPNSCIQRF